MNREATIKETRAFYEEMNEGSIIYRQAQGC